MEGWIKLHRKIINNKIWSNPVGLKVWLWCLIRANHQLTEVMVGLQTVKLECGQFIFGRLLAGEELGMSPSTVRNWMSVLKQDSYLDIKTTNKFSVVSITKWKEYQSLDSNLDSRVKTNEKQNNTDNNVKNDKNINNTSLPASDKEILEALKPNTPVTQDWQYLALDIIEKLKVPTNKKSSFFKAAKENQSICQTALQYAIDFPNPKIRWNMFFVKYNALKNAKDTNTGNANLTV